MEVGFTGTREGMTERQRDAVKEILGIHLPDKAHHGDCVGADADFHEICRDFKIPVRGHPPVKKEFRAFCDFDETEVAKDYYSRNRGIVDASDLLIATPKESSEQPKGGTWYTVGYARNIAKKPFLIVWPNGDVETHER